jgi:hypothetical protein
MNFNFQDKGKMSQNNNQLSFVHAIIIAAAMFIATLILPGCKKQPAIYPKKLMLILKSVLSNDFRLLLKAKNLSI